MNPLVTIIIPFFDHCDFLREAVESALAQTYANIEVIVVDDASPVVEARALLEGFTLLNEILGQEIQSCKTPDGKLTVIRRAMNGGSAAAKNTGIKAGHGDLIVPLDSDDRLEPDYVETVVGALTSANREGFAYSGVYTQTHVFGLHEFIHVPECTMLGIMSGKPAPTTFLYTRKMFDQLSGYNTNVYHDDDEFWLRALSCGHEFYRVEKPLYNYRKHERGKSTVNRTSALSSFAKANPELYEKHLPEVLATIEEKYFVSVDEYQILHDAFKKLSAYNDELERRLEEAARRNAHLSRTLTRRVVDKVKNALTGSRTR